MHKFKTTKMLTSFSLVDSIKAGFYFWALPHATIISRKSIFVGFAKRYHWLSIRLVMPDGDYTEAYICYIGCLYDSR